MVDCGALLGAAGYCDNAFVTTPSGTQINAVLIDACGRCSATYFQPPAALSCPTGDVDPPADTLPSSTCRTCHAPNGYDQANSAENPHPWAMVDCVDCHGGDGSATNPAFAHVCPPPEVGNSQQQVLDTRAFFLRYSLAGVQLLADYDCATQLGGTVTTSPLDWLAFINPGDLRAAASVDPGDGEQRGCGACHGQTAELGDGTIIVAGGDVVTRATRSVMGQAAGLHTGARHGAGIDNAYAARQGSTPQTEWGTAADYGASTVSDPDYNPAGPDREVGQTNGLQVAPVGIGAAFQGDATVTADAVNSSPNYDDTNADNYPAGLTSPVAAQLFQDVLNQACTACHLQNSAGNVRAGSYRSSGCSACHMETAVDGRTRSADPNPSPLEPLDPNMLTPGERVHRVDHRVRHEASLVDVAGGGNSFVQGVGDMSCLPCHSGTNRTVAQFHGYRLDEGNRLDNGNYYPTENIVSYTLHDALFERSATFAGEDCDEWILDEIWQSDAQTAGYAGQDETPPDIHHERGMGCIDCHGTGALHGRGAIYGRMKAQTHLEDVRCETCHGTVQSYAQTDGTRVLDNAGYPLGNTFLEAGFSGNYWLVSRLSGTAHYMVQVRDLVDASSGGGFGKQYPPGSSRAGQPIYDAVASYAMGIYADQQDLSDGWGPYQPNADPGTLQLQSPFGHTEGGAGPFDEGQGMECYACHAAWQNTCIGCHMEATYDDDASSFFYSNVTGERVYLNTSLRSLYANPITFLLGINDRGKIAPVTGVQRFFRYTDLNGATSSAAVWSDRNGLGNDPQLRNPGRHDQPALSSQPFVPHSIRGRYTEAAVGTRGCLDCHLHNASGTFLRDQFNNSYNVTALLANEGAYSTSLPFQVSQAYGLGTDLWLLDADGELVADSNNAAVFNADRIVEADGTTNAGSNHPLLEPFTVNPDYIQFADTNGAQVARPLTQAVLSRLGFINVNAGGLTDLYYYNSENDDPANTGAYALMWRDYALSGAAN